MAESDARPREIATATIEAAAAQLVGISHHIWDHPELGYEEHDAHALLCDTLEAAGFDVTRGAYGLPTAFTATIGERGPVIALCCEYDALPGIGHACGHNVIAAAGVGAALGLAPVASELGGRLVVLGTPAEEGGGGKVHMIDRGALDGIDAAMMVHPADADLDAFWAIAVHELHCEYHGVAAHAAAAPQLGRNALDAAVLGYMGVAALRQHILADERIHGIITDGGDKPNVVPAHAASEWYIRSRDAAGLAALEPRVLAALDAGAAATGCTMTHTWPSPAYDALRAAPAMSARYAVHAANRGRRVVPRATAPRFLGSTDMGNVSQKVPSIHPMIAVAPSGVGIHTPEFAEHARSSAADRAVIDGAVAMAQTTIDLWSDPELMATVHADFEAGR